MYYTFALTVFLLNARHVYELLQPLHSSVYCYSFSWDYCVIGVIWWKKRNLVLKLAASQQCLSLVLTLLVVRQIHTSGNCCQRMLPCHCIKLICVK
jgi:hypothetical protein